MGADSPLRCGYHLRMLNTISHGAPTDRPPLLIVHGLYGSGRNWGVIAKRLSDERQVIAVDMRNHGDSPWDDSHSYPDLAADLAEVIAAHGGAAGQMDVVGHSMGGKAAMMLALSHPQLVHRLVVADIAPVRYSHTQAHFITAMRSVDLDAVTRRSDAQAQLAEAGVDAQLQSFFTQSLDVEHRRWRLNLDALEREMPHILGFPQVSGSWPGTALFLTGGSSDYVQPEHRDRIKQLFPKARFAKIPGAGHWLHAENPRAFEATVRAFLNA
ncbi:MAG: alpha/beta hydrolase [Alphaproteobacteria bacterium MedPE-SWcel]|nr:MAG: alpha/beta hydrolase [Alphaproteobacteria bacterium MedPE-SWcel]